MRGVYTANFRIDNNTAAKTLCYITVPSGLCVEVLSAYVSNEDNETNEQIPCCFQKVTTLGTPTATTVTPAKHEEGDAAAASTVKMNVTASEPTYGAIAAGAAIVDVLGIRGVPSLSGWSFEPTPAEMPIFSSGDTWGLRLLAAITSADLVINVTFREIG